MKKFIHILLLGILGCHLLACVPSPTEENADRYLDSIKITNKIKSKLVDELGEQGSRIKVKAYRDEVQLTGVVNDVRTQQTAGQIAASVGNIRQIRNDVMVQSR